MALTKKITKIFHSCILIEYKHAKILIDPGAWVFEEKKASVEDFLGVDAVLVTHEHIDHYYPDALRVLQKNGSRIITNKDLVEKMKAAGIAAEGLGPEEVIEIKGIKIKGV